jgi:hypothetical protein
LILNELERSGMMLGLGRIDVPIGIRGVDRQLPVEIGGAVAPPRISPLT